MASVVELDPQALTDPSALPAPLAPKAPLENKARKATEAHLDHVVLKATQVPQGRKVPLVNRASQAPQVSQQSTRGAPLKQGTPWSKLNSASLLVIRSSRQIFLHRTNGPSRSSRKSR